MAPQVKPHRKIGFDGKTYKVGKMERTSPYLGEKKLVK
jgi:hypothetical protein